MSWPISQDYNEAIQDPQNSFSDPELRGGEATTNALGMPMPRSGNFADVYEFNCAASKSKWAIKCFTRHVPGLRERYTEIDRALQESRIPFAVEFQYLVKGIRVRSDWFPILKMRWVEGQLLNEIIRDNLDKPAVLNQLVQIWARMGKRLRETGIAHADLQHGNVLFIPGSQKSSLAVKLIDYDGMFVPALDGKKSGEVGHPNYQHPVRLREGTYSAQVDRFPLLVVATALRALSVGGRGLWEKYDNGDNLLFKESDLRAPAASSLFKELLGIADPQTRHLVGALLRASQGKLEETPPIEEFLPESKSVAERPPAAAAKAAVTTPVAASKAATPKVVPAATNTLAFDEPDSGGKKRRRPAKKGLPTWVWLAGAGAAVLITTGVFIAVRGGLEPNTPDVPVAEVKKPENVDKPDPTKKPNPVDDVKRPNPVDDVKKPNPAEVVKKPNPAEVVKKPDPAEVVKKPDPAEVVKKPDPAEVVKKPDPPEVVKKPDPPEVVKKPDPPEVVKKPDPPEVVKKPDPIPDPATIKPLARWTFETGTKDSIGTMHGTLHGNAFVSKGRLWLGGKGSYMNVTPLSEDLTARTFEVWLRLATLAQKGGHFIMILDGNTWDGLLFADQEPNKWYPGSSFRNRSENLNAPQEESSGEQLIHMVIVYANDNRITLYRNGAIYGAFTQGTVQTYRKQSGQIRLGDHEAPVEGSVEEASVYDRALTNEEVAALFKKGPVKKNPQKLLANLKGMKPVRLPKPTPDEIAAAEKVFNEMFKANPRTTPTELLNFGEKVKDTAHSTKHDPALNYVMLSEARKSYAEKGGVDYLVIQMTEELVDQYELDPLEERCHGAEMAAKKVGTAAFPSSSRLTEAALLYIEQAKRNDNYDLVRRFEQVAQAAGTKDAPGTIAEVNNAVGQAEVARKEYARIKDARKKLADNPDDPAANTAVGLYRCCYVGDWYDGLPLLANGLNGPLQHLAQQELASPADGADQKSLADGWYDLAGKTPLSAAYLQKACWRRAFYWYNRADTQLTGAAKGDVDKRMKVIAQRVPDLANPWSHLFLSLISGGAEITASPDSLQIKTGGRVYTRDVFKGNIEIDAAVRTATACMLVAPSGHRLLIDVGNQNLVIEEVPSPYGIGRTDHPKPFTLNGNRPIAVRWLLIDGKSQVWIDNDLAFEIDLPCDSTACNRAQVWANRGEMELKSLSAMQKASFAHLDLRTSTRMNDFVRLGLESKISTKEIYSGPIEITVVARTEKNNIRLHAFNGACVIFNWEIKPVELRVTRPDGNDNLESGSVATAGVRPLDANTWYTLRWRITEAGMAVSVNGTIVFSERKKYDLSAERPVRIASGGDLVDVQSVEVKRLSP